MKFYNRENELAELKRIQRLQYAYGDGADEASDAVRRFGEILPATAAYRLTASIHERNTGSCRSGGFEIYFSRSSLIFFFMVGFLLYMRIIA